MHAASVHPEPGSNSRANCIYTVSGLNLLCRACLALYTFSSMSRIRDRFEILFSKKFRDSFASSFCLYFNLLLFNCQWSARLSPLFQCRVLHSPTIISQPFAFVKGFFKTFLSFFRLFSSRSPRLLAERMWSTLYHIRFTLSSTFSKVFSTFFVISCALSLSRSPARWQLAHYSTFDFICQAVFCKFFQFGVVGSLS